MGLSRNTPLRADPEKTREWQRRSRSELKRTPINPINRERKAKRREEAFGTKAEWIRRLNCLVCGHLPSDPAHVRSRGAGGTKADLVPLCRTHHQEQHAVGIQTFEARHDLDLTLEALDYDARWQRVRGGGSDLGF